MKKLVFAMMATALLTSCKFDVTKTVTVSPNMEESRQLKNFERITLLGSMDVKYAQADSFSVKVNGPADVIKNVETTVQGNVLTVRMKDSNRIVYFGRNNSGNATVYVTSPDFLGISLMGSGDFMSVHPLDTDTLSIDLKGSGDIYFKDIICDRVNVSVIGSGDVSVGNVKTQQAYLDVIGSGDIEMNFNNSGAVNAQVKGSGDITLKGTVKQMNKQVRGSGDIDTDDLQVK